MSTITVEDVHPLLTVELRINLGPALTRAMPKVGPLNTAAGLERLYLPDTLDLTERVPVD